MPPRYKLELFAALTWLVGIVTLVGLTLLIGYTLWSVTAVVLHRLGW